MSAIVKMLKSMIQTASNGLFPTRYSFRALLTMGVAGFVLATAGFAHASALPMPGAVAPSPVFQGPKAGKPKDNTPKPGVFLNGPLRWGRLVDVWALNNSGQPAPINKKSGQADTLYNDIVVGESIGVVKTFATSIDPPVSLTLQREQITGAMILVIGETFNKNPKSRFQRALAEAEAASGTIAIGNVSSLPPFSVVPRDAAIILNFDRAVNSRTISPETIRFFAGGGSAAGQLPPAPMEGRFIWKSERPRQVIFDPAISPLDNTRIETELTAFNAAPSKKANPNPQILPIDPLGFPTSTSNFAYNVAVFMPAEYNINLGTTKILLGRDGTALDVNKSVTKFQFSPSGNLEDGVPGVSRVFRSGGLTDTNQGFLADPSIPQIIGSQPITITNVGTFATPPAAFDSRLLTILYNSTTCDLSVQVGDTIQQGSRFAQVASVVQSSLLDADPSYQVVVNYLQANGVFNSVDAAIYTTFFTPALAAKAGCFLLTEPSPGTNGATQTGVDPQSTFSVRFSKPMNFSKANPLRNFAITTNPALTLPSQANRFELVVGNIIPSPDLRTFRFVPFLGLPHAQGVAEALEFILVGDSGGLTDLVGNSLALGAPTFVVNFSLLASAPANTSRNFNMLFDSLNEGAGPAQQLIGQITKPTATGVSGRPSTHFFRDADVSNIMVATMTAPTAGVKTPLAALGGRLQTVYRNVDLGIVMSAIEDVNIDVERLHWAPFGGLLNSSDFFESVRIDLSHSLFYPDEAFDTMNGVQFFPNSGLTETSFGANAFEAADHPPETVYQGNVVMNPNLLFTNSSGTVMLPFPKFTKTYTWRDSSYGSRKFGGPGGAGANPNAFFNNTMQPVTPALRPYAVNSIPSIGLPLLVDMRVYPASDPNTKGINGFLVPNALLAPTKPNFSVWSEGGLDASLSQKTVTPDVAPDGTIPTGSYIPPGQPNAGFKTSPGDGRFYAGRLEFAVRVSRAYTHFYNFTTGTITAPVFQNTNVLALPSVQPAKTAVKLAFRGATTAPGTAATDARCFDAYGDAYVSNSTVPQPTVTGCGVPTGLVPPQGVNINFTSDITQLNGKQFLQLQINFESDIVNNVNPEIDSLGIAYSNQQ